MRPPDNEEGKSAVNASPAGGWRGAGNSQGKPHLFTNCLQRARPGPSRPGLLLAEALRGAPGGEALSSFTGNFPLPTCGKSKSRGQVSSGRRFSRAPLIGSGVRAVMLDCAGRVCPGRQARGSVEQIASSRARDERRMPSRHTTETVSRDFEEKQGS